MASDCKAKHGISESEATATENEGAANPFGSGPDADARNRAYQAALPKDSNPAPATPNSSKPVPTSCKDLANVTDTTQISPRFTIADFTTKTPAGSHPLQDNAGLSKAEIACNLRHLATNAIEPIYTYFTKLGWEITISSGFRVTNSVSGGVSDHCIGSAADLIFSYSGTRAVGADLTRVEMAVDQLVKVPYTQMIHEMNNLLHVACRRDGSNSAVRVFWSVDHGLTDSGHGYRYTASLAGSPPVA